MEDEPRGTQVSSHLKVGVGALGVAVSYVAGTLLLGWNPVACLLGFLMLVSLLLGGVAVFCGLFLRANHRGVRLWKHLGVLLVIVVLLPILTVGPGNYFVLIDLRTRLAVAMTGGQDQLQTWALALLDQPRDWTRGYGDERVIPKDHWSDQVRRLKPAQVRVMPVFENRREDICLAYGSGFFHWWIVIGCPGSQPDPSLNDPNSDNWWWRWGDGIFGWQQR